MLPEVRAGGPHTKPNPAKTAQIPCPPLPAPTSLEGQRRVADSGGRPRGDWGRCGESTSGMKHRSSSANAGLATASRASGGRCCAAAALPPAPLRALGEPSCRCAAATEAARVPASGEGRAKVTRLGLGEPAPERGLAPPALPPPPLASSPGRRRALCRPLSCPATVEAHILGAAEGG